MTEYVKKIRMENYIFQITWIFDLTRQRWTVLMQKKMSEVIAYFFASALCLNQEKL